MLEVWLGKEIVGIAVCDENAISSVVFAMEPAFGNAWLGDPHDIGISRSSTFLVTVI